MTLRDYWQVVLRRKWFIVVAVAATVIPAVALSVAQDPIYVGEARMLLQSKPGESLFGNDVVVADSDRVVANEIQVLEGDVVLDKVREQLGLADDPPEVDGTADADTDVVAVKVRSGDPDTAAALANAYVVAYTTVKRELAVQGLADAGTELQSKVNDLQGQIDALDAQIAATDDADAKAVLNTQRTKLVDTQSVFRTRLDQVQVDAALTTGSAQLIQPASVPDDPVEPTPARTAALAVLVGLLLGLAAAFLVDHLDDSIRTPADVAKLGAGLSVLGIVPVDPPPDHRPIALSRPADPAVEAYRSLRTSVQFIGFERDTQVIEVTSAVPGEGKTTTASNLAVVLSQTGSSVVLVDADLRKPRVHELFAITTSTGLTDVLLGDSIDGALQIVDENLSVLIAGRVPPNPSEMLSGSRMANLVASLKSRFDYVVIDTPPVLPVSDAVALSRHVDGVLVVAQSRRTSLPQLRHALANLERVSAPVLGIVLNRAKQGGNRSDGYGYGYSGGYGVALSDAPLTTSAN